MRITALRINEMNLPLDDQYDERFVVSSIKGISDVAYDHIENGYEQIFVVGSGRDIAIILSVKPNMDYHAIRRVVAKNLPLGSDIDVLIYVGEHFDPGFNNPYAKVTCKVRNVDCDFSEEAPKISLDLESINTSLTILDEVSVERLPFGVDARLDSVTHDYTPVMADISIVSPMAQWYHVYLGTDHLSIHTIILRNNYGITDADIPTGSHIIIDSNDDTFTVTLIRPGYEDTNVETACDIGPNGFKFTPNEPMVVRTRKLPSAFTGENVTVKFNPRLSGV